MLRVLFNLITFGLLSELIWLPGLVHVEGFKFEEQPRDVMKTYEYGSIVTTDSFVLNCWVSSLESSKKVSWFKNGEIISNGHVFKNDDNGRLVDINSGRYTIQAYSTEDRYDLLVKSVSPDTAEFDSGSYQCAVTLHDEIVDGGGSTIASVNIYVIPRPGFPTCQVTNSTGQNVRTTQMTLVTSGDWYTLTCFSEPSVPDVQLFWWRNGLHQREGLNEGSSGNGQYLTYIWTPSPSDRPTLTFSCTLQHPGLSPDRTCSISFNNQYAPLVTIYPKNVMITDENDTIVLNCNQDANPQVTIPLWYYDNNVVNSGGRFRLEGKFLHITISGPRDNGVHTITCESTNIIGTGSASATLTVDIPIPTTQLKTPVKPPSITGSAVVTQEKTTPSNESNSDAIVIPSKGNNTGIIIGSVVGVGLLLLIVAILVTLILVKTRRKSSQSSRSQNEDFPASSSQRESNVTDYDWEDNSQRYASANDAFENEPAAGTVDIGLEMNVVLKKQDRNELYSNPNKKVKAPRGNVQLSRDSGLDASTENTSSVDAGNKVTAKKPMKKPKPKPTKKHITKGETEGPHANFGTTSNVKTMAKEYSYDPNTILYANATEKQNQPTDSVYDTVNNTESIGAETQTQYNDSNNEYKGQEVPPAFMKNVEGLTYADLDLRGSAATPRPQPMFAEGGDTVYADVKLS